MPTSIKDFNKKLQEFTKSIPTKKVLLFHRRIAAEALRRIVLKTPVDTGTALGNWQTTIGAPAQGTMGFIDQRLWKGKKSKSDLRKSGSKIASDAIGAGIAKLGTLQPYQTVFITNNVDYIIHLERGSSTQAPHGMVAVTLAELSMLFP